MKPSPFKIHHSILRFVFATILFSCAKDSDLLKESIQNDPAANEIIIEEEEEEEEEVVVFEERTTYFPPINDAHWQDEKGFNQHLVRLEEDQRISYLMFDLSDINTIDGEITAASLEFTILADEGNGLINVYDATANNWTESTLTETTLPVLEQKIGEISKVYTTGTTEVIELNINNLSKQRSTFVLHHQSGDDTAFASKEHPSEIGPKLKVTYKAPTTAKEIKPTIEKNDQTKNNKPIAIADGSPISGKAPLEVSFIGGNSYDDNKVSTYSWNFKDDTTSDEANPTHTFETGGTYRVLLTVTDESGKKDTEAIKITVAEKDNEAPIAVVSADKITGTIPLKVIFKGSDSTDDHGIVSYFWDFKDDTLSEEENPEHIFNEIGVYEVELIVKDEQDLTSTKTITITAIGPDNEAPVAKITANNTTGTSPMLVEFIGDQSTDDKEITHYSWDFDDGTSSELTNPSHTFTEAKTYTVALTVTDAEGLYNSQTIEITVNEAPIAAITTNVTSGVTPLTVNFKGDASTDNDEITAFLWKFDDDTTSYLVNPSHTFTEVKTYTVELIVTDSEGLSDSKTIEITVTEPVNEAPTAAIESNITSGITPLTINFKGDSSTDDDEITSYSWNFDDGSTSTQINPSHTFTEVKTHTVELTVTDAEGLSNSKTIEIVVNEPINEAPTAAITANKTSGEAPLTINLKGDSSTDDNEITSYSWNFDDGTTSTQTNPTHTFTAAKTYTVELTVTDNDGLSDIKTLQITANEPENDAPIATASSNITSGEAPLAINFNGASSTDDKAITSYLWDFKDGSTSSETNPTHTFENAGTYSVELTVTDAEGLTDTDTDTITIEASTNTTYPPNAVFASSFGYNATDATEAFQNAVNSGNSYVVIDKQASDWIIQPSKFFDLSNMTIIFEAGVKLRAKSGSFSATGNILVNLVRPNNITIEGYGAEFKMIKSEYNTGEGRHALAINAGNDVTVKGLTFRDSGGDGIYITGTSNPGSYSENITIEDVVCTNNRRQGMSIISAQNVWVRNSEFSHTNGTSPEAGVDLEPNNPDERLVNINFNNCVFNDNASFGFLIGPGQLTGTSVPISVKITDSEFKNNTTSPENSNSVRTELLISQGTHDNPVKGNVQIERVDFNGSKHLVFFSRLGASSFPITFKDCNAYNVASESNASVIELQKSSLEDSLGGFIFDNFYVDYDTTIPLLIIRASSTPGFIFSDVQGDFIIKNPYNQDPINYIGGYNPASNINVNINHRN